MNIPNLAAEHPPAFDLAKFQLTQFVQQWQRLQEKSDRMLALIEQRRQETGAAQITESEAQALADTTELLKRLDAIIAGVLESNDDPEVG